ncbi:IclR family transcriptional regulator [Acinetobacter indicus]|uniref:IclR family transcriptional regulator n=1 Tax=Acinetobacter indicus TaxID=756892 RepID=UPI000CEBC256|nr:IclR family transcriptional regulator C-terminal domain-containing protein [Acinetobacter indicus]
MTNHQRGIQTVEFSGEILRLVCSSKKALSLSEIAEALDMAPGSAYKYLISLLRTGLLRRNETTLEFEAGPLSLRLGLAKINHDVLLIKAREALSKIAEKYEVNVFASMWSNSNGPTVVFYKEFAGFLDTGFRLGINLSLTRTATGRLFSAFEKYENNSDHKLCLLEEQQIFEPELLLEIDKIRKQGFSILIGTPTPGLSSCAIPVLNRNNEIFMALTAFSHQNKLNEEIMLLLISDLKCISESLEEQING